MDQAEKTKYAECEISDSVHKNGETGEPEDQSFLTAMKLQPGMAKPKVRFLLLFYDLLIFALAEFFIIGLNPSGMGRLSAKDTLQHVLLGLATIFACRFLAKIYHQVWRYAHAGIFFRLIVADFSASILYLVGQKILPLREISFIRVVSLICINLLGSLLARLVYQYVYERAVADTPFWNVVRFIAQTLTGVKITKSRGQASLNRIRIAIIGAGREGVKLAQELQSKPNAPYQAVCFVDSSERKIGRVLVGIPVLSGQEITAQQLFALGVQEVVFTIANIDENRRMELFRFYQGLGFKVKVYDFMNIHAAGSGIRTMRSFDIEELLFRPAIRLEKSLAEDYYRDKVILITGGGGSIGGELCRQLVPMRPRRLVLLDVYENGVYDIQQELKMQKIEGLDLQVEIATVCDRGELENVFAKYHPDIVLHAAAHKHVPLMETNICEAVKNNVFGTLNVLEAAEKSGCKRFIMISTDKAVNPTNVMGATKRMCEMLVLNHRGEMHTSATRFGNVLGSAGSVIPLFKRQIAHGGPVTVTDKRIIRYFMTIPEASRLVLMSGAMARPGELFVLDMGKPVKILDLAENLIRLSGFEPYNEIDIVETGLRPGEKLYEELLMQNEELRKTDNDLIFIEEDSKLAAAEVEMKLTVLREALETRQDTAVKKALKAAVPTYREPEEVNAEAERAEEMLG